VSSGPLGKGPRLWLQPERKNSNGSIESARWLIRDGSIKRSTGCAAGELEGAERALQQYIADKHDPRRHDGDPRRVLIVDVLNVYVQDVAPNHARPRETSARITRLAAWWGDPKHAEQTMGAAGRPKVAMSGTVADIGSASCRAYAATISGQRTASMDLELLRAALKHAVRERIISTAPDVKLPPKSEPRQRWLTRSEVAELIWAALRGTRSANGRSGSADGWHARRHLARFILIAAYTGSRKQDILNACFEKRSNHGYIDLERGLWMRKAESKRATKKRQPTIPLPAPLLAHMRRWHNNGQTFAVEFNGRPVDRIDKAFRQLVKDCGLEGGVVPHTFRHTAITWGMQRGMDPWDASGYFGLSLQTLLEVYGHHHPDHLRDAADKMGKARK
jgi:integrase